MDGRLELAGSLAGLVTFTVGFLSVRLHAMRDQLVSTMRSISIEMLQLSEKDELDAR